MDHVVPYEILTLEGTSYEVGYRQGEWLRENPDMASFFTSPDTSFGSVTEAEAKSFLVYNDKYCPGLNEELQGYADALGVARHQLLYMAASFAQPGHCSHFAILPQHSNDGKLRLGRSYEWHFEDDRRLVYTAIKGRNRHMGFSLLHMGRMDGLNEHGLAITMSAGDPKGKVEAQGYRFWVLLRAALEQCRTAPEAVAFLTEVPTAFHVNYIVAQGNEAALIEHHTKGTAVHWALEGEGVVISTNHYTLPEMQGRNHQVFPNSKVRLHRLQQALQQKGVTAQQCRELLSAPYPKGMCCHHYSQWFGTLWSMVITPADGILEICMGSPQRNHWREFSIHQPPADEVLTAVLPDIEVDDPQTFFGG